MQPLEIFAEAFGWTLLHTLWIGVAIAAVYALILNIARPQKAQVRYGLGMGSLLVMVIGTTLVFWQSYDRVQAQREDEVRIASIDANELWLMEDPPRLRKTAFVRTPQNRLQVHGWKLLQPMSLANWKQMKRA